MYFYVYYSYEPWGRGYIGRRQCKCDPSSDNNYFGSFRDKTFSPSCKIILEVFPTLEKAIEAEIVLHDFFQVDINPEFANKAKQTSTRFSYAQSGSEAILFGKTGELHPCWGRSRTKEEKDRISRSKKGKKRPDIVGDKNPLRNPEIVKKISGPNAIFYGVTGEDHPSGGTRWWVNRENKCVRSKESPGTEWILGRKWTSKTTG
jgi:hypothetical protein